MCFLANYLKREIKTFSPLSDPAMLVPPRQALQIIISGIPGHILECGTWGGGVVELQIRIEECNNGGRGRKYGVMGEDPERFLEPRFIIR